MQISLFIEFVACQTICGSQLKFVRNSELGKFREKKVKDTFKISQAYDAMGKNHFCGVHTEKLYCCITR